MLAVARPVSLPMAVMLILVGDAPAAAGVMRMLGLTPVKRQESETKGEASHG
jgi:hypothetical protein